jgi:signal transduction histidine kinase
MTTAIRAFAMATAVGQCLSTGSFVRLVPVLAALAITAAGVTVHEVRSDRPRGAWSPLAEGVLVGVLVAVASVSSVSVLLYLAIPAVIAGVRHGWITTVNTALAGGLAFAGETVLLDEDAASQLGAGIPWMLVGCGAGLLAAHLTRSMRRLADAQAPLRSAHRTVTELSRLLEEQAVHLDASTQADALLMALRAQTGASAGSLVVRDSHGGDDELASFGRAQRGHRVIALPLRVGDHTFGSVRLERGPGAFAVDLDALQTVVDQRAIEIETALLVERVRATATEEERRRLARDLHDGAAQRVVGLLWMIDELSAECTDPVALARADELRRESKRLVDELRLSLFELHQDSSSGEGLGAALTAYVRELSARSDLRVHLTLDEHEVRLATRTEAEVMRIAQEAIGNAHRHARAINLWITLVAHGSDLRLVIEDDGVGGALPRPGHYGLRTMQQRSQHIGADLEVGPRPDGGTVVRLNSRAARGATKGRRDDDRLAHR